MPNTSTTTTRKANAGSFRKGADPRRHVHTPECGHALYKFTAEDCSAGFFAAIPTWGVSMGAKLHHAGRWPSFRRQVRRRAR
jgi:hypothetical protein